MQIAWTEDIPGTLWHVVVPYPAFIVANNNQYTLTAPALNVSGTFYALADAENAYIQGIKRFLSQPITLSAQLMGIDPDPVDGSGIAVELANGGYNFGTWDETNQQLVITGVDIPKAEIVAWSVVTFL